MGHVGIRRLLLPVALAASCTALGCIGARQRPDPLDRIRVGVDPVAESLEVVRALERGGWVLESRVAGRTFVALVLVRSEGPETEGPETAVRIVTRRGTALAVDSAEAALRLVEPPVAPPHDLDGDGLEEILLGRQDATQGRLCLRTLTVGREGALSVAEEVLPSLGDDACVEEVRDVLPESGPEALSVHRFHRLSRGLAPAIAVPLVFERGGWTPVGRARAAPFHRAGAAARREGLAVARQALDVERAYVLAVELAALARSLGAGRREQVLIFDDAVRGLVLSESLARSVANARSHVAAGWPD